MNRLVIAVLKWDQAEKLGNVIKYILIKIRGINSEPRRGNASVLITSFYIFPVISKLSVWTLK